MNKAETASYLASLSQLLKDQDGAGGHTRSKTLGEEFEKTWDQLKQQIEDDNDTGSSKTQQQRPKAGADQPRSQSRRG